MGNTSDKAHYETAAKTGVFSISKKLGEFPPKLISLCDVLRTIDLSNNRIASVPPDIGQFLNLKHLRLNRNCLESLPEEIGLLKKLESLQVADNILVSVPNSITNLTRLKQVS